MIVAITQRFGRLDIVVNNAAIRLEAPFDELRYADWQAAHAVCVDGAFHCTQSALPHLRRSDAGSVINIGGMTAHTGATHRAHVVSAKAELGGPAITVNCVSPGLIDTTRQGASASAQPAHRTHHRALLGRRGRADEVA